MTNDVPGVVVVLNGCSSAGKSSLAKELQRTLPEPFIHLSLDAFRAMEPDGYWESNEKSKEELVLREAALCRAMNAAVCVYANHGQNVIFDHVLTKRAWTYLLEDLSPEMPTYLVGVSCALEELVRREQSRHDRAPGLALSQWSKVHAGRTYDFSVDTTSTPTADCSQALGGWLMQRPPPLALARLRASQ
jgi:chloramphenicol 3-O phosphotransferase